VITIRLGSKLPLLTQRRKVRSELFGWIQQFQKSDIIRGSCVFYSKIVQRGLGFKTALGTIKIGRGTICSLIGGCNSVISVNIQLWKLFT